MLPKRLSSARFRPNIYRGMLHKLQLQLFYTAAEVSAAQRMRMMPQLTQLSWQQLRCILMNGEAPRAQHYMSDGLSRRMAFSVISSMMRLISVFALFTIASLGPSIKRYSLRSPSGTGLLGST